MKNTTMMKRKPSSFMTSRAPPSRSSLVIDGINLNPDEHITGRYSVTKLHHLRLYERKTSKSRAFCVVMLSLFPAVVTVVCVELIPLGNPREGLAGNVTSLVRSGLSHSILTIMFLLAGKQELLLGDEGYSFKTIMLISLFTSLGLEALWLGIASLLCRYPVPFRELVGIVPWTLFVVIGHWIFARQEIATKWASIKMYLPVIGFELALFYFFLALSMGFARVTGGIQIAMVLAFPIIKVIAKKWLWDYSLRLPDLTTSVTVCMAEISGSLYQTLCIQYATSHELSALIMVMDFMQIALEVRMYLGEESLQDSTTSVASSLELIGRSGGNRSLQEDARSGPRAADANSPTSYSQVVPSNEQVQPLDSWVKKAPPVSVVSVGAARTTHSGTCIAVQEIDGVALHATIDELVGVEKALHRVFACEVLVFVEFMKISMPILYGLYVRWVHALPHTRPYNLVVSSLSSKQISAASSNAATYAILEGAAFSLMCWFIQRHYGISPLHQLAFVLESYWMTFQGKLLGSIFTIICSITMHQGIDFTFRFEYSIPV